VLKKIISLLMVFFLLGCAGTSRLKYNYDVFMKEADEVAQLLCEHSEFSSCYWKAVLGSDIDKLPREALDILDEIERITRGKTFSDLTECEKGQLLGLWQRFGFLVSKEVIEKVVPFMLKVM